MRDQLGMDVNNLKKKKTVFIYMKTSKLILYQEVLYQVAKNW